MALPINVEDLLRQMKVEFNRLSFLVRIICQEVEEGISPAFISEKPTTKKGSGEIKLIDNI